MKKYFDFKKVSNGFVLDERDEEFRVINNHVVVGNLQSLLDFLGEQCADFDEKVEGSFTVGQRTRANEIPVTHELL
jgi:hypothetical protein